jgi:hypothetical protein
MEVAMRKAGTILGIALAAALGACMQHNAGTASGEAQTSGLAQGGCPMTQLRGVHATVADIKGGVAITFTGPEGEIDRLRDGVRTMAKSNDQQGDAFAVCPCSEMNTTTGQAEAMPRESSTSSSGQPYSGGRGQTAMQGSNASNVIGSMPLAKAKVDEIPTGAILLLTASDEAQASNLRSTVRQDVRAMKQGCMSHGQSQEHQGR